MRNVSDKCCRENQNTHFMFSNRFLKIVSLMRKRGKNILERGRPQMTIWRVRIACWIRKATNTQSQYVIIIALPQKQWLHERASMLRYTYITCIVTTEIPSLRVQTRPKPLDFYGRKNPQHAFLRRGK